jgi:hypothetical protein
MTIQNASSHLPVYISYDGSTPTVPGGSNTGIEIAPGQTAHFARNEAAPQSNCNAVLAVQTSGFPVVLRYTVAQVNV